MISMPNPEQTDPHAVAVAVLKQAYQRILSTEEQLPRVNEPVSKLELDAARHPSDQQQRVAVARRRLALHGLIGLLMAASIGVAASALRSHDDAGQASPSAVQTSAAKGASLQPAPPALAGSVLTAAPSPEPAQLLQSIAREHAAVELEIEQLKASIEQLKTIEEQLVRNNVAVAEQLRAAREQMARDRAAVAEQLKAAREQMARDDAAVVEQLKASQEQVVRDNAAAAEQLKASQEQMAGLIAKASEQKPRPKTSAPPPRPIASPTGKPVPKLSPSQARAPRLAPMQERSEQH
jgi:hypothetical protein